MAITVVLLLSSLGFFAVIAQAQDCSRPVGDNMDLKGNDISLTSFPNGTTVTFACSIGYVTAGGSPRITCTAGSWSPLALKCQRYNCGSAEGQNGQVEYHPGTEFGDKAVLICNPGHMPVGGGELTCGSQGWLGRFPVCEVSQCESPPVVENGSLIPNKDLYEYSDVIEYTCKKGYTLVGSRQLHCSDDGTFKPEPPRCIEVKCGDPEIPFGQWISGARPPYGYKSTVTLQCNTGYRMNGIATVMCDLSGQWSPGLPLCIRISAPATTTTSTTRTSTTTTSTTTNRLTPKKPTGLPPSDSGSPKNVVIGVVVAVVIVGGLAVCCYVYCNKNGKKGKRTRRGNTDKDATSDGEDVLYSRKHDSLVTPQLLAVKTAS